MVGIVRHGESRQTQTKHRPHGPNMERVMPSCGEASAVSAVERDGARQLCALTLTRPEMTLHLFAAAVSLLSCPLSASIREDASLAASRAFAAPGTQSRLYTHARTCTRRHAGKRWRICKRKHARTRWRALPPRDERQVAVFQQREPVDIHAHLTKWQI
eukprot:6194972-Pleurochrysis_carterae.AAC.1